MVQKEDADFIISLQDKAKAMWDTDIELTHPYAKFQRTSGGTTPMHLHHDKRAMTFLMYLTDGGAGTIFPNANVTIVPKKGPAFTWLNYDKDGRRNTMADHAVQAHPESAGSVIRDSCNTRRICCIAAT